jgi:hypothetical protein
MNKPLTLPSEAVPRSAARPAAGPADPPKIRRGSQRRVIDPRHIERTENLRVRLTPATKHPNNPLMIEDRPWEIRWDDMKPNVSYDPRRGLFELWYTPFIEYQQYERLGLDPSDDTRWPPRDLPLETHPRKFGLLYACSDDGLTWHKPELGLLTHRGREQHNIVQIGGDGEDLSGPGVQRDPRESDPARRYKMLFGVTHPHSVNNQGLGVAFSRDGQRWHSHRRVLGHEHWPMLYGDAHNCWLWAESLQRYVGFTQSWTNWDIARRIKLRTESQDFLHWSTPEPVRYDPDTEVHTHVPFACGDAYLALLHIVTNQDGKGDGNIDIELAWSGDTRVWRRVAPGQHVIPRGEPGRHDSGCVFAALSPLVVGDHIHIYYCGNDSTLRGWRRGSWCLATLPRDRWAAMTPENHTRPGSLTTLPRHGPVGPMAVSAEVQDGGCILVHHLPADGSAPSVSEPIRHGSPVAAVVWKRPPRPGPHRLRFEMRYAALYAYGRTDEPPRVRPPGR